ncbi:Intraflagellar transport protein 56 [Perkinsus chesapeaki]|uniref:Intraflagellar transport protein 56 n=1 Tax=Perkinsus chesapeaki TaxID=330153 RepID=A0A7J6M6H4_PERCH|nr:Intraflagellar transport protein 56 [Perkinsus chesapeaki]
MSVIGYQKKAEEDDFLLNLGRSLLSSTAAITPANYEAKPAPSHWKPCTFSPSSYNATVKDSLSVDTSTTTSSGVSGDGPMNGLSKPIFPDDILSSFPPLSLVKASPSGARSLGGHYLMQRGKCSPSPKPSPPTRSPSSRIKKGNNPPRGVWRNRGGYIAAIYVDRERVYAPLRKTVEEAVRDRAALEQARLVYTNKESLKRFVNTVLRRDSSSHS